MKRFLKARILLAVLFFLCCLFPCLALAANADLAVTGGVTGPVAGNDDTHWTTEWTVACADGTGLTQVSLGVIEGYVLEAKTAPGSTAPTADYDIRILDPDGIDIMGGELADRSATDGEQASPKVGNAYKGTSTHGTHTLEVTNNSVVGATFTLTLYGILIRQ